MHTKAWSGYLCSGDDQHWDAPGGYSVMNSPTSMRDMHAVSRASGIEESRIRFYEMEFRDHFEASAIDVRSRAYTPRRIAMLQEVHDLMVTQRLSAGEARRVLTAKHGTGSTSARVMAVTSGKGGVGKTTVATNLALAFSRLGRCVLLADADLGLANVHVYAGLSPRHTVVDLISGQATFEQVLTEGMEEVKVICGDAGIAKMANLDTRLTEYLGQEIKRLGSSFDVIILDTAAGISQQVIQFLGLADDIVLVTTPNIAATLDAYGVIKLARQSRLDGKMHLLVNQVENEEQSFSVFDRICAFAQQFLGCRPSYLGHLVRDPLIEQSNQGRRPLLMAHPTSDSAGLFVQIASGLLPQPVARQRGRPQEKELVPISVK